MVCRLGFRLGLLIAVVWASPGPAGAQGLPFFSRKTDQWQRLRAAGLVPLDQVPAPLREKVRITLEKPTLFATGPGESFQCQPDVYAWLLDHPDRTGAAWRRLGADCLDIVERSPGRFAWSDELGNDLWWETVYRAPGLHVWYAEGQVKPSPVLPMVPARAVAILRYSTVREQGGAAVLLQQADVFVYTDSRAAALATRLLGPSAPRMAEQSIAQMQMFFSALAWYCQRYPDRMGRLFDGPGSAPATQAPGAMGKQNHG